MDYTPELKDLEEKLWIAEFRFDLKWMNEVLADDFFEYGRSGKTYSRDDCLNVPRGTIEAKIPLPNFRIRKIAPDVFQATYQSEVFQEGELQKGLRSSIWLKTERGWKLKFHQGTKL